ncbi:MAG TPA: alpha/beta fold hydrolase [Gemmatimonadaceae bacterium]|nr:alpha/beta fold hydrolase [Gemmatimonadaceae bacterium]
MGKHMAPASSVTLLLTLCFLVGLRAAAQVGAAGAGAPLPAPSGPHALGTVAFRLVDTAELSSRTRLIRPLAVRVFYPAVAGTGNGPVPYVDGNLLDSMAANKYLEEPEAEMRDWKSIRLAARRDAKPEAPPIHAGWPVVIFSHGFGVSSAHYAALGQELASRGYVILSVDHPYGGFALAPDGSLLVPGRDSLRLRRRVDSLDDSVDSTLAWLVKRWAHEGVLAVRRAAAFAVDARPGWRLRLNTTRVAMIGHSLGGAAALQACRDEPMIRACIDMDGQPVGDVERFGVGKPFLTLLSQPARRTTSPKDSAEARQRQEFAAMGRARDSMWTAIMARHPDVPSFVIAIEGTGHMTFSDAPFELPAQLVGVGATLRPAEAYSLVIGYVVAFLDHVLRGRASTLKPGLLHRTLPPDQ